MSARNTFAATRRSHAILEWLKSGDGVTIQRVIDTFGIQYPQAREDLKLLEELYDLSTHRDGRVKVWTWSGFDPDYVSVATAAALELGGIAMDLFRETPYVDEIDRLAEHCKRRVGQRQQPRLERVSEALHLRRNWLPVAGDHVSEVLEEVLDAIFLDHGIAIVYERSDGEVGHYILGPTRLVWYQGRLWLLALHDDEAKLFDLAGVESLERVPKRDDSEAPGLDALPRPEEYFANAFGIYAQGFPVRHVRLEVDGPWATYLRRYRLHPSQQNTDNGAGVVVDLELGLCPEFKSFVLGMVPHVRVLAPSELDRELRERVERWA